MKHLVKLSLFALFLYALTVSQAQTINAASCNSSDVQSAVNSAPEGGSISIPAGTCTWTSGVTISGKGVSIQGAGSGRIVAYSSDTLSVGTGSKTINIAGYSPGFSSSVFNSGETVNVYATGFESSYAMTGTVSSISNGVLTLNVTGTTGGGSTHRWFIATVPSTVLINNTSTAMFTVTEDSSVNTRLSGFKIQAGSGSGNGVTFNYNPNGQAIVLQNCWIQQGTGDSTHFSTDRGVISNCSFDSPTFSMAPIAVHIKLDTPQAGQVTWTQPSYWGSSDTTGQSNIYIESSDFEAYLNATDDDDNGRLVFRYNLMNNAGFGTHGADTSSYGQRYFEYYNNTGVFNAYSDGSTFNLNWWMFVRGGTYVVHDNNLQAISSQDYGTKASINMTVMNLQRSGGPNPCWGAGTSGGAKYHAPRQVGYGRVSASGTAPNSGGETNDSVTYVGDSEPAYIWNNSTVPLPNVVLSNYGGSDCGSPDSTSNYVILNRDYYNGSTAKPGYTPYTYPHPLVAAGSSKSGPQPPSNVKAVAN